MKLFGGQWARAGNIVIRQRGTKYHPGENVGMVSDKSGVSAKPLNLLYVSNSKPDPGFNGRMEEGPESRESSGQLSRDIVDR